MRRFLALCALLVWPTVTQAGAQSEEALANSVRILLRQAVNAQVPLQRPFASIDEQQQFYVWRATMSSRLAQHMPSAPLRWALLDAVDYEARRAGLEPALVLGVIEVESRFQAQAISPVGARGLMQVMPFWVRVIGDGQVQKLHQMRVNVRFGCVILRHYLDKERGDMVRALARYNGSLGQTQYASQVLRAAQNWR
ncbi:MAG: transglycosylase SLT domain-containing protein [Formosimonas sp.]